MRLTIWGLRIGPVISRATSVPDLDKNPDLRFASFLRPTFVPGKNASALRQA
jgi:hypothetical protein